MREIQFRSFFKFQKIMCSVGQADTFKNIKFFQTLTFFKCEVKHMPRRFSSPTQRFNVPF